MNINNIELPTLSKEEAILNGAKILYFSINESTKEEFAAKPILNDFATLAKLALEKPLTARSRNIKEIVERLSLSSEDFKKFYFNLIINLDKYDGLMELSKLYPSNIEVSVTVPYVESLKDPKDIEQAFEILESNCWWYSNHKNNQPKGLILLNELHKNSKSVDSINLTEETDAQGSIVPIEQFPTNEIAEPASFVNANDRSSVNDEANFFDTTTTIQTTSTFVPEATEVVEETAATSGISTTNVFIPEENIDTAVEPIEKQVIYSLNDLSLDVPLSVIAHWSEDNSITYQGFKATESIVALTNGEETIYPLSNVVKEIVVTKVDTEEQVMKLQFILQNVTLKTKDPHLAIWAFNPKTQLEGKDLKYALGAAISILHPKAINSQVPLVLDDQFALIIKNKPINLSLESVILTATGEVIFPGQKGEYVYVTK